MKFVSLSDMPDEFKKGFLEATSNPLRPFAPMFMETNEQTDNALAFLAAASLLLKEAKSVGDAEEALRLFKLTAEKMQEIYLELAKKLERINS